jgi:integrase
MDEPGAGCIPAVTDKGIQPNHAWRHTFKARALRFGIREHIVDAMCGHAPASVGRQLQDADARGQSRRPSEIPTYELDRIGVAQ